MGKKHLNRVAARILSAGFLLSMVLLGASCTREVPSTVATVHLGMPKSDKVGGLSAAGKLSHIIINVQGPGIASPILVIWDGQDSNVAAPTSFAVDIPTGPARLFQALLVFEDTTTGGTSFYYGDLERSVDASTNSVTVVTTAAVSPAGDGHIAGRMMMENKPHYTGRVALRYSPKNNRPPMLIERTEVFAGWFSVFGMDGIAFSYLRDDGVEFFGAPVDVEGLHDSIVATSTQKRLALTIPDYWESRDSGISPREFRKASKNVYGWFGDDPDNASRRVCYYSGSTPIDWEGSYSADAPGGTLLQWQASYRDAGGVADSTTAAERGQGLCSGATQFADVLSLHPKEANHHDGALSFRGPYARYDYTSGGDGFITSTIIGSSATFHWRYLPGVQESLPTTKGVAGSDLFIRFIPSGFNGDTEGFRGNNNNINCAGLHGYGFVNKGSYPVADESATNVPIDNLPNWDTGSPQYVLCPYSMAGGVKSYYASAIYGGGYFSAGSGGNIQFATSTSSQNENFGTANIEVTLSNSSAIPVTVNYSVTGGTATAGGSDYTLADGTLTFAAGQTIANINITINNDGDAEPDETVSLQLSMPINAALGVQLSHVFTIIDDD